MTSFEGVRAAIDGEIATCAARVRQLLAEASQLSEREVFAAGDCVGAIQKEACANVTALKDVTHLLESRDDSGGKSLGTAISAQAQMVTDLISRLRDAQSAQRETTDAVVSTAANIGKFVGVIGDIAMALRVLTLNARIEAAHHGADGTAFATIAESMRSLTTEVQRANGGIGELSEQLTSDAANAKDIDARLQTMLIEAERVSGADLEELLSAFHDAQSTSATAARDGVVRAERMVELTNQILSHLQFQDRMAQVLGEANQNLDHLRALSGSILERAETENIDEVVSDVRAKLGIATVRLSGESELASSEREMESGVVMLF